MINSVTIHGNVASFNFNEDKNRASVLMAYNESYKLNGKLVPRSSFIWIETYGKLATNVQKFVTVGDPITVQGKLTGGNYQDKNDDWQNSLRIFAKNIQFHYRKPKDKVEESEEFIEEEFNQGDSIPE
jgi:single-stranded DNA-binding protein